MDGETFITFCAACLLAACFANTAMGMARACARQIRKEAQA
ncbi:hypothetical protein P7L87_26385 [Vibrio parahaemolyticus]|nr:hypothetical protein [Vibrio parahaemolyticus]